MFCCLVFNFCFVWLCLSHSWIQLFYKPSSDSDTRYTDRKQKLRAEPRQLGPRPSEEGDPGHHRARTEQGLIRVAVRHTSDPSLAAVLHCGRAGVMAPELMVLPLCRTPVMTNGTRTSGPERRPASTYPGSLSSGRRRQVRAAAERALVCAVGRGVCGVAGLVCV